MTDARALIQALDGARLQKQESAAWGGFCEGELTVPALEERSDMVRGAAAEDA